MRILVISNYYPPVEIGGWEQLTRDMVQKLRERGHQVNVLTSNYRVQEMDRPEIAVKRVLHLESPDFVRYHPHYTLVHRWWERWNQYSLRRSVASFLPDVIFINGMWNLPQSVAREAEGLLPNKVVYYMASYWPIEPDAHTSFWNYPADSFPKKIVKRFLGEMLKRTLIKKNPRNSLDFPLVLCVSAYLQEVMVNEAGIPRNRTRVVHNGIELDIFKFQERKNSLKTLQLLYAGQLSPHKGIHTALESISHLADKSLTSKMRLSIVGDGPPEYISELKKLAERKNISHLIEFRGKVSRGVMPDILSSHDVLLLPSLWPEPLARIIQEAMACGLVVIGTNTGGTPEILQEGINGFIFEPGDARMLAEKISQVMENPDQRKRVSKAGRRLVEERYSFDRMVDEVENYLISLSEGKIL